LRFIKNARCVVVASLCALLTITALEQSASAQAAPKDEKPRGTTYDVSGQLRVRSTRIEPLELSGTQVPVMQWTEQRMRLDASLSRPGLGSITFQGDALDGVLFGDNGEFAGDPSSNSGISLSSKVPNLTRWTVGLPNDEADAFERTSYIPVLEAAPAFELNYLYGDVILPIGLLRVGRQPISYGASIAGHDGGRYNRFGVSKYSDAVDRILFGTKIDEAIKIASNPDHTPNTSLDSGVVFALFYDFMKQDSPQILSDDLRQMGMALELRRKSADWLGFEWGDVLLGGRAVYLRNEQFDTDVFGLPFIASASIQNLDLEFQYIHTRGKTREISEGFAALSSAEPQRQQLTAHGARAVADVNLGRVVLTMEFDYASGDGDPRSSTPITSFSFARDMNVGLLLFEHIIAFESARSVAVGVENLSDLDVESFPLTEVQTDGRFTNAVALFPQIYVDLVRNDDHRIWLRSGALIAWPEDEIGLVDPVMTTLSEDGSEIRDDAVNFHGGKPGNFYGVEVDAQIGWNLKKHFDWVVEGGILFPGNSLQDENGDAVNSYLIENRFVFTF
jgi:hypothetical protein